MAVVARWEVERCHGLATGVVILMVATLRCCTVSGVRNWRLMLVVESGSRVRLEEFLHSLGLLVMELLLHSSKLHAVVARRDADLAVAVVLSGLRERHSQLEPF